MDQERHFTWMLIQEILVKHQYPVHKLVFPNAHTRLGRFLKDVYERSKTSRCLDTTCVVFHSSMGIYDLDDRHSLKRVRLSFVSDMYGPG